MQGNIRVLPSVQHQPEQPQLDPQEFMNQFMQFMQSQQQPAQVQPTRNTLTVKETAELIGVSPATIYAMVREEQIKFVRVRGRILFHRDTIEQWLQN